MVGGERLSSRDLRLSRLKAAPTLKIIDLQMLMNAFIASTGGLEFHRLIGISDSAFRIPTSEF